MAWASLTLALFCTMQPCRAHDHFPVGVLDSNANGVSDPGEPLEFVNRLIQPAPQPETRLFHLMPRPLGFWPTQRCGGYYGLDERPRSLNSDAFSCIVLSNGENDEPQPETPHDGAWIWFEFLSVTGPDGGRFGFWDEQRSAFFQTPSVSFPANEPISNLPDPEKRFFVLSEGGNTSGADPYGHIHQRSWTATRPGRYQVTFRLVDRSTTNGAGPWHTPSRNYTFTFVAGPDFQPVIHRQSNGQVRLEWPSLMGISTELGQVGITFAVQRSTSLLPGSWETIGSVTGTTQATASFLDSSPPAGAARVFYRLTYLWAEP